MATERLSTSPGAGCGRPTPSAIPSKDHQLRDVRRCQAGPRETSPGNLRPALASSRGGHTRKVWSHEMERPPGPLPYFLDDTALQQGPLGDQEMNYIAWSQGHVGEFL